MKSRKIIAMILVTAMVMTLFTFVVPLGVSAEDVNALADTIGSYSDKLEARADPAAKTVTVTGRITGATSKLVLDIDEGVTVIWKADIGGAVVGDALIELRGMGTFEVAEGGFVVNHDNTVGGIAIIVPHIVGGKITLRVNGGMVKSTIGYAIIVDGLKTVVTINKGEVSTDSGTALLLAGNEADVTISGGKLVADSGMAISIDGDITKIAITGGEVSAKSGMAIIVNGNYTKIAMSGGAVSNTVTGTAVHVTGTSTAIEMSDGIISAKTGQAINISGIEAYVSISGGEVTLKEGWGYAIGVSGAVNADIKVSGGTISSMDVNSPAIYADDPSAKVTVSGGFVFSYGSAIKGSGPNCVIDMNDPGNTRFKVEGNGVVCAWTKGGVLEYDSDTQINLISSPAGTASWGVRNVDHYGINYENGTNVGFFRINEVGLKVTAMVYTVKFATDGGGTIADQSVTSGNKATKPADPKKEGFEFKGWFKEAALTNAYNFDTPVKSNFTLYAKWEEADYTVKFETNGGGTIADQAVKADEKATKPADPKKEGFEFKGWFKEAALTNAYDFNTPVKSNLTLYAKWEEAEDEPVGPTATMRNFVKKNTYVSGFFSDVDENEWYGFNRTKMIATAYEYGLMQGGGSGAFNPTGDMLINEAITIAARVHKIYTTGTVEGFATGGSPWHQVYVDYAISNGIIFPSDFGATDWERPATRAEMAYIFSNSLPASELAKQNTVNTLPDVNASTPYRAAIVKLYEAGIVLGDAATGAFRPNDKIIRAEAATIISRVILPTTRESGKVYG